MAFPRRASALSFAIALIALGAIATRERVVDAAPKTAVLFSMMGLPVNLDRLEIGPVQAAVRIENDLRALVVDSEIVNPRRDAMAAPLLRFSIRDASGATVYTWTKAPGAKTIAAGARLPVRARLTAPPAGQDVIVEFVRTPA